MILIGDLFRNVSNHHVIKQGPYLSLHDEEKLSVCRVIKNIIFVAAYVLFIMGMLYLYQPLPHYQ